MSVNYGRPSIKVDDNASCTLGVAILTVSDTRTERTDTSGDWLANAVTDAGHDVIDRAIAQDDRYAIRAVVSSWIVMPKVQVIISTGGTGFSERDVTPEALMPLFDREIVGFGEYFRNLSISAVGASTIQSRAVAGFANGVIIFALPGSTNACRTAWTSILRDQLDSNHKPCNFVPHLKAAISEDATVTRGRFEVESCQSRDSTLV